eukprot:7383859-Prymnesium_polylepis.1
MLAATLAVAATTSGDAPVFQVHTLKHSILRLPHPPPDGHEVRLVPHAVGCEGTPRKAATNGTFFGGTLRLYLEHPWRYAVCSGSGGARPLATIEALRAPKTSFDCAAHFGLLCPSGGPASLPPEDIALAHAARLRLYVYTAVPPSLHWKLFERDLPAAMRSGRMCDFVRGPCTPAPPANP